VETLESNQIDEQVSLYFGIHSSTFFEVFSVNAYVANRGAPHPELRKLAFDFDIGADAKVLDSNGNVSGNYTGTLKSKNVRLDKTAFTVNAILGDCLRLLFTTNHRMDLQAVEESSPVQTGVLIPGSASLHASTFITKRTSGSSTPCLRPSHLVSVIRTRMFLMQRAKQARDRSPQGRPNLSGQEQGPIEDS
jgi:hypothetical protein